MPVICNAESSKWTGKTEYPSLINIKSNNEPKELISPSVKVSKHHCSEQIITKWYTIRQERVTWPAV